MTYHPSAPGIYPPSAPTAVLASTPWEVSKFTMELHHHGVVRDHYYIFDLTPPYFDQVLRGMVFSAWFVDKDLMVLTGVWLTAVAHTLVLTNGVILTFDREKLRVPDNL